jgi:autotransporter-associated beta strand protein
MKIFARLPLALVYLFFVAVIGVSNSARAGSATWDLNPGTGDWNMAANWTPMTVPNGVSDTATFALSNTTNVSISADTQVNGITFTAAATKPYTIGPEQGVTLTVSGTGVTNNSGVTQSFTNGPMGFFNSGTIVFTNHATAGTNVFYVASDPDAPQLIFKNNSTAGGAGIENDQGSTNFTDHASAGNASIGVLFGSVSFSGHSTAANANFGTFESDLLFTDHASAGNASIFGEEGNGYHFLNNSTAAHANIVTNGEVDFSGSSNAGNAFISVSGNLGTEEGGQPIISFLDSSTGGAAQIQIHNTFTIFSFLDISGHNAPGVTIGSIEGDGIVVLGSNNLTVGSNNLSTVFSGVIAGADPTGQGGFITGGSLTKIGTGTLTLSGVNTYTGNTKITGGVLQVDGSITSNTFVGRHGTLAGTGTINGVVTNGGTVSPGDAPGTLTVNSYTQAHSGTLLIDIAGGSSAQFSVLDVLGNANLNGVLDPMLLNGFIPTIGESFTFMDYGSLFGAFSRIQNQTFDNGMEHWVVTYQPTFAVLTAETGRAHVPDQSSTLLLLTLSLVGVVMYRHGLPRKQA